MPDGAATGSGQGDASPAESGSPGRGAGRARGHTAHGSPRARVWVMRAGQLVPVPVRTGLDDGTLVEVSGDDLKEGDVVVVNAVRPNQPKPEGGERAPGANPRPGAGGGFRP